MRCHTALMGTIRRCEVDVDAKVAYHNDDTSVMAVALWDQRSPATTRHGGDKVGAGSPEEDAAKMVTRKVFQRR